MSGVRLHGDATAGPLDAVFADVRARLAAHGVELPLDALYRDEHLRGARREVLCLAPHGGGIEPWTRFLARTVHDRVDCDYWSAWAEFRLLLERGVSMDETDRLCKMLHVTSHRIWQHPELYPELRGLMRDRTEPYRLALAVHGKADDSPDSYWVEIGGTSGRGVVLLERLAAHGIVARGGAAGRAGLNPANVVNQLAAESIQVEIPRAYRRNPVFGWAIAQAMAETLEEVSVPR